MTTQRVTAIVGTVLFLAYCYGYFGWALAAAALIAVAWLARDGWQGTVDRVIAERQRHEHLAARADVQNAQVANGDPRGTYGDV